MKLSDDLVSAVVDEGIDRAHAEKAVSAVIGALRKSPRATMIFRKVDGRSVKPEDRRTIFLCG
jgi:hypothetical protein